MRKQVAVHPEPEEIVDATNLILGRMATYVAKQALNGKRVIVVNAEKAVISGTKERVVARAKTKLQTRTLASQEKAPTHPRRPDTYVRRVIRGMLPWKKSRGKQAFHRVRVYMGIPPDYLGKLFSRPSYADASRLKVPYVSVAQLAEQIGGVPA
ncbi:MAG TPA: 50S ribosomal protein L13 [Candidatus Bathyarchaeia archaeon]